MFLSFIFTALAATAALGASISQDSPETEEFRCASDPGDYYENKSKRLAIEAEIARSQNETSAQEIIVDVYMHSIADPDNFTRGHLSDETLLLQLAALNDAYRPSGISFSLQGIDRAFNGSWAQGIGLKHMQQQLHKGTKKDLNLYFVPAVSFEGLCQFPWDDTIEPYEDGCMVKSNTVPGGASKLYNLGKTAVHEVGHWFGLYHTFQGGCHGDGDEVEDTPKQAFRSIGCPIGKDTCRDDEGLDPIHNYMDYSQDSCYTHFTPGQTQRMVMMWNKFRA